MTSETHYSSTLDARLAPCMAAGDYAALTVLLGTLSNSARRTAGYMIGERYAPCLPWERFWDLTAALVAYDSRAFLVTMLKAFVVRLPARRAALRDEGFASLCRCLNGVERQKALARLLPAMEDDAEVMHLFATLGSDDRRQWLPLLLQSATVPCYYVLFSSLRYVEDDRACLVRMAAFLIRKGDPLSFNLASLMKEYFGLDEVKGTFSLRLRPYQLSRIEQSFGAFRDTMRI